MLSKYVIHVEAPQVEGKHDDLSDALVRMVWLATTHAKKVIAFADGSGRLVGDRRGPKLATPSAMAKARLRARQTGSHPSRMVRRGRNPLVRGPWGR